ncbi:hypothetical protein [Thermoproteus sp. CP80]|uniref:hypothetical protein n=1 Tax=Thermoproteus sp. CP80 TaxID=1650659 RepID=UPI001180923D|nr:hypothetical protein [Thermoproteus sp. CP80]
MVEKVCMDKPWQYGVGGLQQPGGQTIYGGVAVGPPSLARSVNARLMIRALLLVLVVAIAVFVGLYFIGHGRPHDLGGAAGGSTAAVNSTVLGYVERVLAEARELYVRAVAANESDLVGVDPLGLILNGTFINSTALAVGHTQYRCVILEVYYNGFAFFPGEVQGSGIRALLLPRPRNVTYTGGWVGRYLITYDGKTYDVTLFDIPFMESSSYVSASTQEVGGLYIIQIWVRKPLNSLPNGELWLILAKP